MHIQFTKDMIKRIAIYASALVIAIIVFTIINHFDVVWRVICGICKVLLPFILGLGIAFVLNKPVMWFESTVLKNLKLKASTKRFWSTLIMFILFIALIVLLLSMLIPSLIDSIQNFVENFSEYMATLDGYVKQVSGKGESMAVVGDSIEQFFNGLNLNSSLSNWMKNLIPQIADYSYGIIKGFASFVIACASAFYLLMDKKNMLHGVKTVVYSLFPKHIANYLTLFSYDANNVFEQYIVGNLLDSLIIGFVTWVFCFLVKLPYAPMVACIIGVTNIIPMFGPFLGAIPVILLYLLISPISALIFSIFILILQQIDGNVIKPIILGDRLGLSGFWILFSVTIGGALFGVFGMFLGVPVFALIYASIKDLVEYRLEAKHIQIKDEAGIID